MAISNVDDLYNELSGNESFSGLFDSSEDFASALEGMSPERRDAFFEKMGLGSQVSKVDFDKVLKKKENFSSNFQLAGDKEGQPKPQSQNKPSVPNPIQPTGTNQIVPPTIKLFPDEPAPGSPLKRKTIEERFPLSEEEKKKQKQLEGIQAVMKEQEEKKDIYTPPKKKEITKADIEFQNQLEKERKTQSDMPVIKKIDWQAIADGKEFVKQTQLVKEQKDQEALNKAKNATNSLFDGINKGMYDYVLPDGQKFTLDEYAIGRALFENEPIEVFSKTGVKVDVLDPTKDILKGEANLNVLDERSITDHLKKLGLSEEQADDEILRLKKVYLQDGAKAASQNLYEQLLTKWNGNQALANQNYINYWNNRGIDLLEGSEKEAYHVVKQMEAIRSNLINAQKKGGLASYDNSQIQSYRKQLDDLQDQLSELRDNPNNLYDWRTGQFIDARIQKNEPRVSEIQQENKEFQAKYGDKPKEVLVKRRDELLAQRAFIMGKMQEYGLDIPEEGTWDAAVRALQISAAKTSGEGLITLPDGRRVSADVYNRKMDDYNSELYSVMSELYGLNRAVMLNENVALKKESEGVLRSITKNLGMAGESIVREFAPGTTAEDANSEYNVRNSLLNSLEQSGYNIDPSLRSAASASVTETISGSAGMLANSILQIALGNIAVPEVMSMRWAKGFKDLLTSKYGNIGGAVFEQTAGAIRSGLIFEAANQGFATGVGEFGAQAAFDALNLDKILGAKGKLAEFLYRTIIGGAGETFEEVAGQYIQGLTDAGFDPIKAFKDSFGVTPESRLDQLKVIGITSLGFSGASNLKVLTATRSTLNEILDNPKLAAAYGEVLTTEKKQQIDEVLKAIDDKLADKQSRETNQGVTASESSEYTPRLDAEQSQQQVNLFNEERKKALEELTANGQPESEEQKAQVEQKAADINAFYDQKIADVMPKQTKFDTATGTNMNAVMGNADLNSQETQDFIASLPNARARRNAATLIAVANNANTTLQSVLPNAKVVLHSRESFRDKMSQVGAEADRKGNFSIIKNSDGTYGVEIQINVEDGSVTDIAHEVTHGVLFSKFFDDAKRLEEIDALKQNPPATEQELNTQIQEINTKYEKQFSETLGNFKEQLKELVSEKGNQYLEKFIAEYDEDAKAEEYLTELVAILSKNGEQIRQEDPSFFTRLMALLNKLVGVIGKEAGIKLQKFNDTQEVIDFFNTVASSIRKGEVLGETKAPQVETQTGGAVENKPRKQVGQVQNLPVFHGGTPNIADKLKEGDVLFVTQNKAEAERYAKQGPQGEQPNVVNELTITGNIATEDEAMAIMDELDLKPQNQEYDRNELMFMELVDPNMGETSLSKKDIEKFNQALKEKGYDAVEFVDNGLQNKEERNIYVFNSNIIQPKGVEEKTEKEIKKYNDKPRKVSEFGTIKEEESVQPPSISKLGVVGEAATAFVRNRNTSSPKKPTVEEAIRNARAIQNGERPDGLALKDWAKENKYFLSESRLNNLIQKNDVKYLDEGVESTVYRGDNYRYVYKIHDGGKNNTWEDVFKRIMAHNFLFPDTSYEITGFSEIDGNLVVLLKQPFVQFEEGIEPKEIDTILEKNGYEVKTPLIMEGVNNELGVKLMDLHNKNVVRNAVTGEPSFIDPDITLTPGGPLESAINDIIDNQFSFSLKEPAQPLDKGIVNKGRVEPWSTPQQEISSAGTSINKAKLPSVYSDKKFLDILKAVPGRSIIIADIGSGKYANTNIKPLLEKGEIAEFINDASKKMLTEKALPALEEVLGGKEITYLPYDPFNQPAAVNDATVSIVRGGNADVAVSPNVLNVIAESGAREGVIANLADAVGTKGTAIIQIYEGESKDRGMPKETKTAGETSWQNNQPTSWYLPEVQAYFANVKRSGNIIIADNKGQTKLDFPITGSQKLEVKNKARIEEKVKESKSYGIPQRYKGDVGKMIGGDLYVHDSANDILPQDALEAAESKLPEGFEYEVIKYNAKDGSFSFIASPDWNTSNEPIVGDSYKVKKNGEVSVTRQKADPQIYHHKWNFVRDDYNGFDVEKSIQRSIDWYRDAKADINMFKIGTQSYWKQNAVPLINDTTSIINKGRKDRVDFAIVKDYEDFRNKGFSVDGAYFELEKMNYAPGDIKRYIPEIAEAWRKRSVNKFFATIRRHQGKIAKRQGKIREELQNNPGLDFDTLYDMLKNQYEDFELFKAFYEEGANPTDLDKIFGTEYRETIQKAMSETRDGKTVYNKDFLRTIREDVRSRKMVDAANQMNNLFGFFNGVIDNDAMIQILADGLEETGLEFSLKSVTDDIRQKRAELEQDLNTLKKIGKGEVDPNSMVNVARLLSLAGRMLRMGRGLFKNQESFEKAIFDYLENINYKNDAGIIRKIKGFKLTDNQKKKIREAIKEFREAKIEYDKEIELLENSQSAYTDEQFESFDKSKIKFEQAARKLKVTIDAYRKKSTGNWFTSMTAQGLLSMRTIFIGLIGNLEMMLAATPKKGKFAVLGWSRALANKLVSSFTKKSATQLSEMIKRGAYGNIDPTLYRKMAWEQGVQQIRNIFENTIASTSTNEDSFFETQTTIDSTRELPTGLKMAGMLMKNLFQKGENKLTDQEWADQFDQLLVLLNEKDENGVSKLALMNPKGYQAATTLLRGIFGYIPTGVGKMISLSGDRVFYQLGYYEALASYAYSQGITDPNEVQKFIRANAVPNSVAQDFARREGEKRIFAQDNKFVKWFSDVRGNIARAEKTLFARSVKLKKEGKYIQRFTQIYPQKVGLATKKMGLTIISPFTRIPSNFVAVAIEKTLFPYSIAKYWYEQNKLNRLVTQYDELFNVDVATILSPTKLKEQERMRAAIFEQQRIASRSLTSTFQAIQVATVALILLQSGAVGAPYGDDEEEKKAARAAGVANQPPGKINLSAFIDYLTNGFDSKGRVYKEGDITFQYTNLGIFGFGLTWAATLKNSLAAKEFEDRKIMGVGEDGYSDVTMNMIANSITNGITSLSFIQNIASLVSAVKTKGEGLENFGVNLAKTALTVPTLSYGLFGGIEKAEGISADNMRNYFPDLEADESIGSKFKIKVWTSLTGKSPITLFGLRNSKGEFLSPYASPYYQPQIGPHGEELYKKNTFWDVRSNELSDRVAAYLQASFDPFSFSDYEGFVSSVKVYSPKDSYKPGDILDYNGQIYAVRKPLQAGFKLQNLNTDLNNPDVELITDATNYFNRNNFILNKKGSEATTNLYDLMALYQQATGSRKEFALLNRFYEPFLKGKDSEGEFGIYIPLKYQRELSKLRGDVMLKSYDQNTVKERIATIQRAADEMSDEEFNKYVEEQVESLLLGPIDPVTLSRSGGIKTKMNDALNELESQERYRTIKRKAIEEALKSGLFSEEEYNRMKDAEGIGNIVSDFDKSELKFRK